MQVSSDKRWNGDKKLRWWPRCRENVEDENDTNEIDRVKWESGKLSQRGGYAQKKETETGQGDK